MKLILFAAAVLLVSCATTPSTAPKASAPKVAAAVPTVKEVSYEVALPTSIKTFYPNGDPSGSQILQYSSSGLLSRQETYNANGVLVEVRTGKAKGDGWRVTVSNAQSGEVVSLEDLVLGAKGEVLSQTFLNPKEIPQAINEFAYDALGQKATWLAKSGSGGLQARTVYTYDKIGNNTKTEVFDGGAKLTNVFQSTYDDKNRLVKRDGYNESGVLVEQTTSTWKDDRRIKEETTLPFLRSFEYTYDEKSAPTVVLASVRGKIVEKQVLTYQWFTKTKLVNP